MTEPTLAEMKEAVKWAELVASRVWLYWGPYSAEKKREMRSKRDSLRAVLRLLEEMEDDGR